MRKSAPVRGIISFLVFFTGLVGFIVRIDSQSTLLFRIAGGVSGFVLLSPRHIQILHHPGELWVNLLYYRQKAIYDNGNNRLFRAT